MRMKKVIGIMLAGALALGAVVTPTSAANACYGEYCPPAPKITGNGGSSGFPFPVACVMGSAFAAIWTAWVVGRRLGRELTPAEAQLVLFSCGLGVFPVLANAR